jgi:hypothetical protein
MARIPTNWLPNISGTVTTANNNIIRLQQDGITKRILQDGTTKRILQPNVISLKPLTTWKPNIQDT